MLEGKRGRMQVKIKALVFAPYPGLVHTTSQLKSELMDFDITVIQGDLSEVLPVLRQSSENGYDIIISRGGTAKLVRQHTSLPVVGIQVSGYDIMRTITLVKGYEAKYEMIGFADIIENVADVASMMKVHLPYQIVSDEHDVDAAIKQAKERGVRIVVGDTVTVRKANESGMQGVLITSGRESVLDAFSRAKQICRNAMLYKNNALLYRRMVENLEQGAAVYNVDGGLIEANDVYKKMLPNDEDSSILFELISKLKSVNRLPVMLGDNRLLYVTGECLDINGQHAVYILINVSNEMHSGLTLAISREISESFPPLITSHPYFISLLQQMHDLSKDRGPIILCGESGSGRRLLAAEAMSGVHSLAVVNLTNGNEATIAQLEHLIDRLGDQYLHLRLLDHFDDSIQDYLLKLLNEKQNTSFIISSELSPRQLNEEGRLQGRLYKLIKDRTLFIPPLRDGTSHLKEFFRTFIVNFNEKYGKQIIGMHAEVEAALLNYAWPGNLLELRDTMERFITKAQGSYIDEELVSLIGVDWKEEKDRTKKYPLDLHQPLEAIEQAIIKIILEEENMNQTKAAERLGINRTTLWRKIRHETDWK